MSSKKTKEEKQIIEEACASAVNDVLEEFNCIMVPSITIEMNQIRTGLKYVALDEDE